MDYNILTGFEKTAGIFNKGLKTVKNIATNTAKKIEQKVVPAMAHPADKSIESTFRMHRNALQRFRNVHGEEAYRKTMGQYMQKRRGAYEAAMAAKQKAAQEATQKASQEAVAQGANKVKPTENVLDYNQLNKEFKAKQKILDRQRWKK